LEAQVVQAEMLASTQVGQVEQQPPPAQPLAVSVPSSKPQQQRPSLTAAPTASLAVQAEVQAQQTQDGAAAEAQGAA
jgi:hypothetical protein